MPDEFDTLSDSGHTISDVLANARHSEDLDRAYIMAEALN